MPAQARLRATRGTRPHWMGDQEENGEEHLESTDRRDLRARDQGRDACRQDLRRWRGRIHDDAGRSGAAHGRNARAAADTRPDLYMPFHQVRHAGMEDLLTELLHIYQAVFT